MIENQELINILKKMKEYFRIWWMKWTNMNKIFLNKGKLNGITNLIKASLKNLNTITTKTKSITNSFLAEIAPLNLVVLVFDLFILSLSIIVLNKSPFN